MQLLLAKILYQLIESNQNELFMPNAILYQIRIMFMVASSTIGVSLLFLCCYLILAHPEHQI